MAYENLLTDDEVIDFFEAEAKRLGCHLIGYEISWFATDRYYRLEVSSNSDGRDHFHGHIRSVGEIGLYEENALETVIKEGRALYYRLRKLYPTLKRDLGRN